MNLFRCGGGGDVTPKIYGYSFGENVIGTRVSEDTKLKLTFTIPTSYVGKYLYLFADTTSLGWVNPSASSYARFTAYSGIDITTEEILKIQNNLFFAKYKIIDSTVIIKSADVNPQGYLLCMGLPVQINYPQGD